MATQGMNQSDPLSTKIFNIVVEAMFKQYLSGVCYLEVTYHRIGYGLVDNGGKKSWFGEDLIRYKPYGYTITLEIQ